MEKLLILVTVLFTACAVQNMKKVSDDGQFPFSLHELENADQGRLARLQYINASDSVALAYRGYVPENPSSVLIFYHGATAHSGSGYQHLSSDLAHRFDIAVYTPDVRGHGYSGGRRGDSPTPEHVWDDISTFVRYARSLHPGKDIFLGGHSAGAGMLLNYSDFNHREPVSGYLYLSPYLGFRAKLDTAAGQDFVSVDKPLFIQNAMEGTKGNDYAVHFHLPPNRTGDDLKMVDALTVNMSKARTPTAPATQLRRLSEPLVMWIGEFDEAIDAKKAMDYISENNPGAETHIVSGENHLGILVSAADFIGPWLQQR